jgi:eukaryotic-like serine/threonine-protein kinase
MTTAELDLRASGRGRGRGRAEAAAVPTQVAETSAVPGDSPIEVEAHPTHTPAASKPHPKRRRAWPVVLAVLLVVAALAGGVWWLLAGPGSLTRVPTVAGLSQDAAARALQQAGLRADVVSAFDETVPTGTVIGADPGAGAEVRKVSAVTLTVSKGQERYAAPSLVGTPAEAAQDALAGVHLALGERKEEYSESVAAGTILAQDPAAGTSLKPATAVAITVSKGRQPISVADYTGKSADQAKKALGDAGLRVVQGDQVNSDSIPAGAIVSQKPSTGTLFKGDTVTLVVSKGPVLVAVPATVGKPRDEATRALKAAGFQVSYNLVLGGFFGTVRASDPAAGTLVPKGSTITLTVV